MNATDNGRRIPEFFIVGHFKSGTTALYESLRRHPQIFMPYPKELWYFSPELRSRFRRPNAKRPDTWDGYLALFESAAADQHLGECSPSYLLSEQAAQRIAEKRPDAKIIAIFREPASFVRSFHLQLTRNHFEDELDLRRALEKEPARRRGEQIPPRCGRPHELLYADHVRYTDQLRRFHDAFGREQVLTLIYEDYRRDNHATLRSVHEFLGTDPDTIETVETQPSRRVRSQRLHDLMSDVSVGRTPMTRLARSAVKALTPQRLRRSTMQTARRNLIYAPTEQANPQLMADLRERFRPEVEEFGRYLGRDLTREWGAPVSRSEEQPATPAGD
ncbi:MAG TPA: sulfotransferase [Solirubrobacteraceae bacterium]|nr:sulfotransferase [Solirubrobacteraceae bacterium]